VVPSRLAAWAVLALVLPALAGCASKHDTPAASVSGGTIGGGSAATGAPRSMAMPDAAPINGTSARWHFHDYWHGKPTIILADQDLQLQPSVGGLSAILELPQGVIVPPETGYLTVNVTWPAPATGVINLTYRPSDSNDFATIKDAASGSPVIIPTSESMCDVPHRQKSLWAFNLTAMPSTDASNAGAPTNQVHVVVRATIGRPLFIDPPHFNWWQGGEALDLVKSVTMDLGTVATAQAGNVTAPDPTALLPKGTTPPTQSDVAATARQANESARIPATGGRIVPEGAANVVVLLNWTPAGPQMPKLRVTYQEQNFPSSGAMPVTVEGDTSRIFVLPIQPGQTDTTYSNRTTWEFHVLPEGDGAAAFKGTFTLTAWTTRLSQAEAVAMAKGA
jgi:hypothetical protein